MFFLVWLRMVLLLIRSLPLDQSQADYRCIYTFSAFRPEASLQTPRVSCSGKKAQSNINQRQIMTYLLKC